MSLKSWGNASEYDREELAAGYEEDLAGDASFWKPVVGENEIRLLPPPGLRRPYAMRSQHWLRNGNQRMSFNCPAAEDDSVKCFLCGVVAELKASDNKDDKALANDIKAKPQWLYIILDMEHPKKGPQVYGAPKTVCQDIARLVTDKKDYGPIILDPVKGYNLVLTREGTSQNDTEYSVRGRINPEDVTEFIEKADPPDIAALCEPASNKDMQAAYEEIVGAEEEQPRTRRRSTEDDEPRRARDEEPEDKPRRARDEEEPRRARDDDEPRRAARDTEDDEPKAARPGRRLRSND
jgi:hypothetical protein